MDNMSYWQKIWETKGNSDSNCLKELDGFESTDADMNNIAKNIITELDIKNTDSILEIGCGAGGLAKHLKYSQYIGVDYSKSLVKKHIQILNNSVIYGEANDLIFKDNSFDKVICYSVFHYFPNHNYANQCINEMKRVAKNSIYIGDLPFYSTRDTHLLYNKSDFNNWNITDGYYNNYRFNISLRL